MSSAADTRNRNGGNTNRYVPPRGSGTPTAQTQGQNPPRMANTGKAASSAAAMPAPAPATNPWTGGDRSRNSSKGRGTQGTPVNAGGPVNTTAAVQEATPINEFAGKEATDFLRKAYSDAIAGDTENAASWTTPAENKSSGSAWGAKPHLMASGGDFWVHFAKQVASREQGGGG